MLPKYETCDGLTIQKSISPLLPEFEIETRPIKMMIYRGENEFILYKTK